MGKWSNNKTFKKYEFKLYLIIYSLSVQSVHFLCRFFPHNQSGCSVRTLYSLWSELPGKDESIINFVQYHGDRSVSMSLWTYDVQIETLMNLKARYDFTLWIDKRAWHTSLSCSWHSLTTVCFILECQLRMKTKWILLFWFAAAFCEPIIAK